MRRVAVVDTNVLVSALMKPSSVPTRVAQSIRHGTLMPVVCSQIVDEYRVVLARPGLRLPPIEVEELVDLIGLQARWVRIGPYLEALQLPDAGDWPFIACALASDCPVITGNMRHFPKSIGVVAVTPLQWLARKAGTTRDL